MKRRGILIAVAILLVAEAAVLVLLPGRVPRPVRMMSAGIDLVMATVLWSFWRQNR